VFGDADLPTFFADFGVAVFFEGSTATGILDRPVQTKLADQGFGGVGVAFPAVRLPYNAFSPMPDEGDQVNVDGKDYTVAEITSESDGAVVCLDLKAASL
jgi:hypothetical protein